MSLRRRDPHTLAPGLYEDVLSASDSAPLSALEAAGAFIGRHPLGEGDVHALVRSVADKLRIALDNLEPERQLALTNALLARIGQDAAEALTPDELTLTPELLLEIAPGGKARRQERPRTSLARSDLFTNADRHAVVEELRSEIASADRIVLLCSFVKWSGFVKFRDPLEAHCRSRGRPLLVLTTTYLGATDAQAVRALHDLGAEVLVSYEETPTRLHAKAWLFERDSGFSTAYIGSSNLSHAALTDGIEWNVRVSATDLPHVIERFASMVERYQSDPSCGFTRFDGTQATIDRLHAVLRSARASFLRDGRAAVAARTERGAPPRVIGVEPRDYQRQMLEDLEVARRVRGQRWNLIVAATGTGKTILAALDYKRLFAREAPKIDTLLFVAHREDILTQSLAAFREVLSVGEAWGELYVSGYRPKHGRHVFASIQSLKGAMERHEIDPAAFDLVIIDEVHHAAADSYERLLARVGPEAHVLGMTATPERTEDQPGAILALERWFPRPWASELRLWDAIERQILVPFNYFALDDGTDLRRLGWVRGRYAISELSNLLTAETAWIGAIARAVRRYVRDPQAMRAVAFCVDRAHAAVVASEITRVLEVRAEVMTSETPIAQRETLKQSLRSKDPGRVRVLCVVDLLNEGTDLPALDTVLMLRPTESATVFLQQLGRGLRRTDGKEALTVLDFVGIQHERFRFDARYQALTGVTARELRTAIKEHAFPRLPAGCVVHLDRKTWEQVTASVRKSLGLGDDALVKRLADHPEDVTLRAFLDEEALELDALYRKGRSWHVLKLAAGRPVPPTADGELAVFDALQKLVHVDDPTRIALLRTLRPESELQRRALAGIVALLFDDRALEAVDTVIGRTAGWQALRAELSSLAEVLASRSRVLPRPPSRGIAADVPLAIHARYQAIEILSALGMRAKDGCLYVPQTGVVPLAGGHEALLVTLDKASKATTPHLQYNDFALSPTRFHWESAAPTRRDSIPGRRHVDDKVHHLLFVREIDKDERGLSVAYRFLGAARPMNAHGERPIAVEFEMLDAEIPADLLTRTRAAVG